MAAILLALFIGAVLIYAVGINPWKAYRFLVYGAFGSPNSIAETIVKSCPLVLAGLGFAFAFRCGLFNIGAEGQLYLGALASILVGIYLKGLPAILHAPIAVIAAALAGGIWGAIPGYLKARFGISEIINTIMMNYIGIYFVSYLVHGPLREPPGYYPQTARIADTAAFPKLIEGTRLHAGVFVALLAAFLVYHILKNTTLGYQIKAVGYNREAARFGGINVSASFVVTMAISGALAGLAGANEMLGVQHRLLDGFSPGYGYDAIAVALLGRAHPAGVFLAALLFGSLRAGANMMQRSAAVPVQLIYIIQGLVVLFVIGSTFLMDRYAARAMKRRVA
ncbi:MAG TPA: ABC transporter permease [Clostridia bacterium]|nr:ABC transporter permease [Clostridia bacterium]